MAALFVVGSMCASTSARVFWLLLSFTMCLNGWYTDDKFHILQYKRTSRQERSGLFLVSQ